MSNYTINYSKIIKKIKENNAGLVCIQLPEGLKPEALSICDRIEEETDSEIIIWGGTNYGGCDIPLYLENLGIDLIVHFGHNEFPI